MYVITEWLERYEVNDKGQPAKKGDKLRATSLKYVRSKVHGHAQGAGFSIMQEIAGDRDYEVFGIFHKFLEIAADADADHRGGNLLNSRGRPATIIDLAKMLRVNDEKIKYALSVLTSEGVEWVKEVPDLVIPGNSRNSAEFQEKSGTHFNNDEIPGTQNLETQEVTAIQDGDSVKFQEKSGALYNETKRNETEHNLTQLRVRACVGEDQTSEDPSADKVSDSTIARADSSSTSTRQAVAKQFDALNFDKRLRELLEPRSTSDVKALWNLEHWALARGNELCERIVKIAADCGQARKPIAAFFSRLDEDVGYRAKVEADRRK